MTGVYETSVQSWIWILGWPLAAIAVVGNSVVIYLIASKERLHTTANAFILSLAVADMCVGMSLFPILAAREYLYSSNAKYQRLFWLSWFFLYSSAVNICVMTADRFLAINAPLKYVRRMANRRVGILISMAWLLPFSIVLPMAFVDTTTKTGKKVEKIVVTLYFWIFELLPCIVLLSATARIFLIVRRQRRETAALLNQVRFNRRDHSISTTSSRLAPSWVERSAIKVLIALVTLFIVCYIFAMCCSFCLVFDLCGPCNVLGNTRFLFLLSNSAGNPLAYAFLKRDMRKELLRVIPCGTSGTNENTSMPARVVAHEKYTSCEM